MDDLESFPSYLNAGTHLAVHLGEHLSWLRSELKLIALTGTPSELASLHATIKDVKRLLRRFVN